MRRLDFPVQVKRAFTLAFLELLAFAPLASAQFGTAPPTPPPANQLPLSGRSGQTGGAGVTQLPVPGTTSSVNTLSPTVSVQGPYTGSASSIATMPFTGKLSLADAINRGLRYNLGAVGMEQALRQSRSQARAARSGLLPTFSADVSDTEQTFNLRTIGFNFTVPGFTIPALVGPFNVMDIRGRVSQTIANFTTLNNYRAARELAHAGQLSARDAQDLVVLAVAGQYLEVIAAQARLASAQTQLETANVLYQRTQKQLQFGRAAQLDVNRSHVAVLLEQQRVVTLENDLSKQKITLARMTGLPPDANYDLSSAVPYAPAPPLPLDEAIKQALAQRSDLQAAEAQVEAAERALRAAKDERLPSASFNADYGVNGPPSYLLRTYTVGGTLSVPIWNGGRTASDIQQAEAALAQRRAELSDIRNQVESDVRNAYLDLQAAASQVEVAQQNIDLMRTTLQQTRQRFEAGVSENYEVVQSQESVSGADLDYIDSVFAHNLAKLSLARALGDASGKMWMFLSVQPRP